MDFFSFTFFAFAFLSVGITFLAKKNQKTRLGIIILCGFLFLLKWNWQSALLALMNALLIYWIGQKIETETSQTKRKFLTAGTIVFQILVLFTVRIFSTFSQKPNYETTLVSTTLFIGVAYYALSNISYAIEVYRSNIPAERSAIHFLAYSLYFPKLLLGPIEKYQSFQTRLINPDFTNRSAPALYLISLGLFKKLVISTRIMSFYNEMQASYNGGQPIIVYLTTAVLGFFVVYSDFSAYMNIGQAFSLLLGIELSENFKQPYFANSPLDYWQRWHITLSHWMRDYVYYPMMLLSKNIYLAIVCTFIVVGLWHGFQKELLYWAIGWGFFQMAYIFFKKHFKVTDNFSSWLRNLIGIAITFSVSVFIGLHSYHLMFFKKEILNPEVWLDAQGAFLYKNHYTLFIFIALMILLETLNKNKKSNVFYWNAAILLIFLTSAFMLSKSYFFYYMRL